MTSRPASYRSQPACANCRHVHEREEDLIIDYFCTFGAGERFPTPSAFDRSIARTKAWAAREVSAHCVCDEHSPAPIEPCPAVRCPS